MGYGYCDDPDHDDIGHLRAKVDELTGRLQRVQDARDTWAGVVAAIRAKLELSFGADVRVACETLVSNFAECRAEVADLKEQLETSRLAVQVHHRALKQSEELRAAVVSAASYAKLAADAAERDYLRDLQHHANVMAKATDQLVKVRDLVGAAVAWRAWWDKSGQGVRSGDAALIDAVDAYAKVGPS